jgi:hypothetical protein
MSFAELKKQVATLSPDEHLELSMFLAGLLERDEIQYRATIYAQMNAMDAGREVTAAEVRAMHEKLRSEDW